MGPKFAIGDKVRAVSHPDHVTQVGYVVGITGDAANDSLRYVVAIDGVGRFHIRESWLEYLDPPDPT